MINERSVTPKQEKSKAVTVVQEDLSLAEYGTRQDVVALARRIKSLLPGGDKMNLEQAMSLAQYSMLTDSNPFRGEIYGYVGSRGEFVLVEGYKLLVRWAKRQCPYSERYEILEAELPDNAVVGYRCHILRDDAKATLFSLVEAGARFDVAFGIAATSAVGVVTKLDMTTKAGKKNQPPKGWTWDQVARKRALKNALNLSHGAPSPKEIAAESWMVNGVETKMSDWTNSANEGQARLNAETRETTEKFHALDRDEKQARRRELSSMLYGDDSDNDLAPESEPEPESAAEDDENEGAFASPHAAIAWGMKQGCFKHNKHATNAYNKLKEEEDVQNATEMAWLWRAEVAHRLTEQEDAKIAAQLDEELENGSPPHGKSKLFKEAN